MTEILGRILNIVQRVKNMTELSEIAMIIFGAVFVFGVLNCILGYRILRFWMMLFGFGIGAGLGLTAAYLSGTEEKGTYLFAMIILGVILAVISFLIYRAGIFVLGAGLGFAISIYVIHPTSSAAFFLCILAGVGLGALAMKYAREVIIVGTSLMGGMMAGFSLVKIGRLPEFPYGLAMSAAFAAIGMLVQFAINKPEFEDDEEEYYDENEPENTVRMRRQPADSEFYDPDDDSYDPYDENEEEFYVEDDFFDRTRVYEPESEKNVHKKRRRG